MRIECAFIREDAAFLELLSEVVSVKLFSLSVSFERNTAI